MKTLLGEPFVWFGSFNSLCWCAVRVQPLPCLWLDLLFQQVKHTAKTTGPPDGVLAVRCITHIPRSILTYHFCSCQHCDLRLCVPVLTPLHIVLVASTAVLPTRLALYTLHHVPSTRPGITAFHRYRHGRALLPYLTWLPGPEPSYTTFTLTLHAHMPACPHAVATFYVPLRHAHCLFLQILPVF